MSVQSFDDDRDYDGFDEGEHWDDLYEWEDLTLTLEKKFIRNHMHGLRPNAVRKLYAKTQ